MDAFELQVESEDERLPLRTAPRDESVKQKSNNQYQSLKAAKEAEDIDVIPTELPLSFGAAEVPASPPSAWTQSRLTKVAGAAHPLAALEEKEISPTPDASRRFDANRVQELIATPATESRLGGITSNLQPGTLRTPLQQQGEEAKPTAITPGAVASLCLLFAGGSLAYYKTAIKTVALPVAFMTHEGFFG